ncbi:hypothetical protein [Streptomyces sp. HNM1019]|uniref:hypothetical protein n=1 Tax=Streptomyces sp. HNM1019 TaxID=3424717 RepID=UPI003D76D578
MRQVADGGGRLAPGHYQHARDEAEPTTPSAATTIPSPPPSTDGDHAYLAEIASFMGDRPTTPDARPVRWLEGEATVRRRWRTLVTEEIPSAFAEWPRHGVKPLGGGVGQTPSSSV